MPNRMCRRILFRNTTPIDVRLHADFQATSTSEKAPRTARCVNAASTVACILLDRRARDTLKLTMLISTNATANACTAEQTNWKNYWKRIVKRKNSILRRNAVGGIVLTTCPEAGFHGLELVAMKHGRPPTATSFVCRDQRRCHCTEDDRIRR